MYGFFYRFTTVSRELPELVSLQPRVASGCSFSLDESTFTSQSGETPGTFCPLRNLNDPARPHGTPAGPRFLDAVRRWCRFSFVFSLISRLALWWAYRAQGVHRLTEQQCRRGQHSGHDSHLVSIDSGFSTHSLGTHL